MNFDGADEGHPDGDEGDFRFLYSREHRLSHAPEIVRDYYNGGGPRPVRGIRILFASRTSRIMLLTLVAFTVIAWITGTAPDGSEKVSGGVTYRLEAFRFEEEVFVSLDISGGRDGGEPLAVSADVSVLDADGNAVDVRHFDEIYGFTGRILRTKFTDYDIISVTALVSAGGEEFLLSSGIR